jgi:hypothetical protein
MKLCEDRKSLARLATDAGSHRSSIWKLNGIDGRADRHIVTRIYHACCPSCGRYTEQNVWGMLEWPETYVLQSSGRTWRRHKKTSTFIMCCSPVTGQAHMMYATCLDGSMFVCRLEYLLHEIHFLVTSLSFSSNIFGQTIACKILLNSFFYGSVHYDEDTQSEE